MLPLEHSAILSTFIKLPFVIKTFVGSIFECPFYTGFTVALKAVEKLYQDQWQLAVTLFGVMLNLFFNNKHHTKYQ